MTLYPVAADFLDRSAYYPNDGDPAAGIGCSRHWLPKREGAHGVGRTGGMPRPAAGSALFEIFQTLADSGGHPLQDFILSSAVLGRLELLSGDILVKLDIAVRYALYDFRSHFRNLLSCLSLESVGHQPLADKLL